jgi:hypothetical protein
MSTVASSKSQSAFEIAMKRGGDQQSPFFGALVENGGSLENHGALVIEGVGNYDGKGFSIFHLIFNIAHGRRRLIPPQ